MQNKLKTKSTDVIETLNSCKVRTVMATGDNVLTSISIARQCSIIKTESEVILGELKKTATGEDAIKPVFEDLGNEENLRRESLGQEERKKFSP